MHDAGGIRSVPRNAFASTIGCSERVVLPDKGIGPVKSGPRQLGEKRRFVRSEANAGHMSRWGKRRGKASARRLISSNFVASAARSSQRRPLSPSGPDPTDFSGCKPTRY
jgi:hypothetical protein